MRKNAGTVPPSCLGRMPKIGLHNEYEAAIFCLNDMQDRDQQDRAMIRQNWASPQNLLASSLAGCSRELRKDHAFPASVCTSASRSLRWTDKQFNLATCSSVPSLKFVRRSVQRNRGFGRRFCAIRMVLGRGCCGGCNRGWHFLALGWSDGRRVGVVCR
jgi:hypothetical protein